MLPMSRVLMVGGSDSSGGAGIQADIKTATTLGAYAATAITAVTAQDTLGVHEIAALDAEFVERQMRLVLDDIGADAVKTGMLGTSDTAEAVARTCERLPSNVPVVVDPVLQSTGGTALFDDGAEAVLRRRLLPTAALLTPNVPEAFALTGIVIESREDMRLAAAELLAMGPRAVLLKGGHLDANESADVFDLLVTQDGDVHWFDGPRRSTEPAALSQPPSPSAWLMAKPSTTPSAARASTFSPPFRTPPASVPVSDRSTTRPVTRTVRNHESSRIPPHP